MQQEINFYRQTIACICDVQEYCMLLCMLFLSKILLCSAKNNILICVKHC